MIRKHYKKPYTLYERNGFFYYRVWQNGKRVARSTGKTNKSEARQYCDNLFSKNKLLDYDDIDFASYAQDFFAPDSPYVKESKLAFKSRDLYDVCLKKRILPYLGKFRLSDITYDVVRNFKINLMTQDISPSYIRISLVVASIIMSSAEKNDLIRRNPFRYLKKNFESEHRDAFTLEEVKWMYTQCDDKYKKVMLVLALTGMRISEYAALGLKDNPVTFNGEFFSIHLNKQRQKKRITNLKTHQARIIPIIKELLDICTEPKKLKMDYFGWKMKKSLYDKLKNAEERKLTTHSFRHFFITDAKNFGINPLKVEVIAGHKILGIEGVYTNFSEQQLGEVLRWQKETYNKITSPTGVKPIEEEKELEKAFC